MLKQFGKMNLLVCLVMVVWAGLPARLSRASDVGAVASALVEESHYRHFLDNELYTHYGDDRWWGPEHDLAQANIAAAFASFGLAVTLEPVPCPCDPGPCECAPAPFYNVVGTKLGTLDPTVEYVVGAHYDSICTPACSDRGAPGADDNASGVALVLEAARVLSQHESDYTIRFVAFDREERPDNIADGLFGAQAYAFDHIHDDIRAVINADMVAFDNGSNTVGVGLSRASSEPLQAALLQAAVAYSGGLGTDASYVGPGDHAPFEDAGFQAVMIHEKIGGNYCYHSGCDSVDTLGYIDYEFATRITRVVVGFLADRAGIHVDIPDGDFTGDGQVDQADFEACEACISGSGTPVTPPCDFFDFDEDGDVDCTDWRLFKTAWTAEGDPPTAWQCNLIPPFAAGDGCRCLEITPPQSQRPIAIRVSGYAPEPTVSCLTRYVQIDGRLGLAPVFQAWDVWGTVYVCDADIHPDTGYSVSCDYGEPGSPVLSAETVTGTTLWADTAGVFTDGAWSPPNHDLGILDVVAILDAFRVLPGSPPLRRVDLVGMGAQGAECRPDGSIDMVDVLAAIDAFRGIPFLETANCALPCP